MPILFKNLSGKFSVVSGEEYKVFTSEKKAITYYNKLKADGVISELYKPESNKKTRSGLYSYTMKMKDGRKEKYFS